MASRNEKENSFLMEAPDRGWSWIVAVACCLIFMLFVGLARIGSLLFVATVKSFNVSRKEASLPFSLASSVKCFWGPFTGFLADRFGVRLTTLTGGLLGAFGIGMCFFTHRILLITIFWGVVHGIGYSMGTTALPTIINEYFDQYRATAIGIFFSGGCLGSFVLPLIVEFCLREYGLNGTFLILSAVILNCVPLALLLRKPSFVGKNAHSKCTSSHFADKHSSRNCSLKAADTSCEKVNVGAQNTKLKGNMKERDSLSSVINIKTPFPETEQLPSRAGHEVLREKFENSSLCEANLENSGALGDNNIFTIAGNIQFHTTVDEKSQNIDLSGIIKTNAFKSDTLSVHNSFRKNLILFRNPMFILIGVSRAVYSFTVLSTVTVLADFANDIGVGVPKVPYILMSLSVSDFLGRLSFGLLVDKKFMTVMQYTATFFLLQALSIASMAWATGFWYLVATSFAYGACASAIVLSTPLLIAECIETKLQTIAMPSIQVFSGFTFLAIPKLIELFREQLGSYVGLFYTMSAITIICSATWFTVPFCIKRRS